MYRRFDAKERAWDAPICLASGTHPRVAVRPDGVPFVTWVSDGIMLARLATTGSDRLPVLRVSRGESSGAYPSLAMAATGTLLLAWQQGERDGSVQIHLARVVEDRRDLKASR